VLSRSYIIVSDHDNVLRAGLHDQDFSSRASPCPHNTPSSHGLSFVAPCTRIHWMKLWIYGISRDHTWIEKMHSSSWYRALSLFARFGRWPSCHHNISWCSSGSNRCTSRVQLASCSSECDIRLTNNMRVRISHARRDLKRCNHSAIDYMSWSSTLQHSSCDLIWDCSWNKSTWQSHLHCLTVRRTIHKVAAYNEQMVWRVWSRSWWFSFSHSAWRGEGTPRAVELFGTTLARRSG